MKLPRTILVTIRYLRKIITEIELNTEALKWTLAIVAGTVDHEANTKLWTDNHNINFKNR